MTIIWACRNVCVAMTIILALSVAGTAARAEEERDEGVTGTDASARPWILVSMGPTGCSGGCTNVFSTIKRLSENPHGRIIHFSQLTPELIEEIQPAFIVLGPQGTPWCRYSGEKGIRLQNLMWTIPQVAEAMNIPILGICGGHQALALAFGGKVGPIRAGEDDCMPYTRERQGGVIPVTVVSSDPLFEGIDGTIRILSSHYDEVKVLPPGFRVLASDQLCPVQIMRHPTLPVYGIQGHPERFGKERPEGGVLLRNFLKIALTHNQTVRPTAEESEPRVVTAGGTKAKRATN